MVPPVQGVDREVSRKGGRRDRERTAGALQCTTIKGGPQEAPRPPGPDEGGDHHHALPRLRGSAGQDRGAPHRPRRATSVSSEVLRRHRRHADANRGTQQVDTGAKRRRRAPRRRRLIIIFGRAAHLTRVCKVIIIFGRAAHLIRVCKVIISIIVSDTSGHDPHEHGRGPNGEQATTHDRPEQGNEGHRTARHGEKPAWPGAGWWWWWWWWWCWW